MLVPFGVCFWDRRVLGDAAGLDRHGDGAHFNVNILKGYSNNGGIMVKLRDDQILQIITTICQRNGCEIKKIDLERHKVDIDGPLDAQENCHYELIAFLD